MTKNIRMTVALLCSICLVACCFVPLNIYGKAAKPELSSYNIEEPVVLDEPAVHFHVNVENPVKGATYTATVSDKSLAELTDGGKLGSHVWFAFYAKKKGTVKVTVKQKLKKKTKKIGTVSIEIKSGKMSAKGKKQEKQLRKVLKSGSDPKSYGVSLEVLKVSKIKNSGNKVTAKLKLRNKITAAEVKASQGSFGYAVTSKNDDILIFSGKLKKGSKTVTVSLNKKTWGKKLTKKGTVWYYTGLDTKKKSPYLRKIKL